MGQNNCYHFWKKKNQYFPVQLDYFHWSI